MRARDLRHFFLMAILGSGTAHADKLRFRAAYVASVQNSRVFGTSDQEAYQAGRSRPFLPFGFEAASSWGFLPSLSLDSGLRISQAKIRFSPQLAEQSFWEVMGSVALRASAVRSSWGDFSLLTGLRWRSWIVSGVPFPSSHQLGLTLGGRFERGPWTGDLEAGLMAIGLGPVGLGKQRDASTLRAQLGYRITAGDIDWLPALEFFHTHRSYFASMIDAEKQSFMVDDMRFSVLLGAEF